MASKKEEAKAAEEPKVEEAKAEVKAEAAAGEAKAEVKAEGAEAKKEEAKEEAKEEEAKGEATDEAKDEVMEEPEPEAKELEEDAPADKRKRVAADAVAWSAVDSSLNVMHVNGGNLLMSVTEGGFQYLLAGGRSTVGLKAGRYMFELKIVESLHLSEPQGNQGRTPAPRNLVRVGVSLAGSSTFLADTADSICFDSEGWFLHGKKRNKVSQKFGRHQTVALLVNLDEKSPNANTVSLFRDGERISPPQKLPENMIGKVLYPHITYKNVTLRANFGPVAHMPLPFTCRMLQDAAGADVQLAPQASNKGPCEVVFPVGLPDQGVCDYVDSFLEQHPQHVELSNRKIVEWATKSGCWRPKGSAQKSSVDNPDSTFGIPLMDDNSVNAVLASLAPALKRNYVHMELRGNLLAEERKQALQRFSGPDFKKVALVMMGEPSAEYKKQVQTLILAEKSAKADAEKRKKAAEEERKRLLEEKKKKAEEARKLREAKRKAGKDGTVAEEKKEEEKEDADMSVEAKQEEAKVEEDVPIELTEEEKQLWYRKCAVPDLTQTVLSKSYASFTVPTKEEGFDEVKFVWQPKDKCEAYLREWLLTQKRTQRAEDLEPSAWFKETHAKFRKALQEMKRRQNDMKDPARKKKFLEQKKAEEAKKKKEEAGEGAGDAAEGEKEEATPDPMEINVSEIEVDTVEDVMDVGNGEPLFLEFGYEDWTLLSTRWELHLLIHAFRKDLNDSDRPSFREEHLAYYFEKYYNRSFVVANFGVDNLADFLEMIEDSIALSAASGMFESKHSEDVEITKFVKLAEEHRRDRARRVDAGDETAQLKFKRPAPPASSGAQGKGGQRRPAPGKGDHAAQGKGDHRGDHKGGKGGGRPTYGGKGKDAPPARYGSSGDRGRAPQGGFRRGASPPRDSHKRTYASSNYPPAKQARTAGYSGGGAGGGGYRGGGGGGYSGGGYSRR